MASAGTPAEVAVGQGRAGCVCVLAGGFIGWLGVGKDGEAAFALDDLLGVTIELAHGKPIRHAPCCFQAVKYHISAVTYRPVFGQSRILSVAVTAKRTATTTCSSVQAATGGGGGGGGNLSGMTKAGLGIGVGGRGHMGVFFSEHEQTPPISHSLSRSLSRCFLSLSLSRYSLSLSLFRLSITRCARACKCMRKGTA